jgi:hypothetical protein
VLSSRVVEAERGRHRTGRLLRGLAARGCAVAWLLPGRGFGTIEEQRARLPPAAECDDERVAGLWRCQIYEENYVEWSTFTLNITRDPGDPSQLRGTISNHGWDGGPGDAMPPTCDRQSGGEWSVSMDALGTVRNEHEIAFGGIGARVAVRPTFGASGLGVARGAAGHRIIPAATVSLVCESIRMKLPVMRFLL